ncbi:phage holin family protein [Streptomyces sp. A475]|uniref:phage holin family protein n=1 Tax=unclassified Streptomyces TaxID=2593676 RepID=UPI0030C973C1
MDRTHSTHTLDNHLTEQVERAVRATLREELRSELRAASAKQRRRAMFYAASGAAALYCGAALALAIGLVLALGLPGWGAALVTAVLLAAAALVLRGAARPRPDTKRPSSLGS